MKQCPICLKDLTSPATCLPCGHIFCESCVDWQLSQAIAAITRMIFCGECGQPCNQEKGPLNIRTIRFGHTPARATLPSRAELNVLLQTARADKEAAERELADSDAECAKYSEELATASENHSQELAAAHQKHSQELATANQKYSQELAAANQKIIELEMSQTRSQLGRRRQSEAIYTTRSSNDAHNTGPPTINRRQRGFSNSEVRPSMGLQSAPVVGQHPFLHFAEGLSRMNQNNTVVSHQFGQQHQAQIASPSGPTMPTMPGTSQIPGRHEPEVQYLPQPPMQQEDHYAALWYNNGSFELSAPNNLDMGNGGFSSSSSSASSSSVSTPAFEPVQYHDGALAFNSQIPLSHAGSVQGGAPPQVPLEFEPNRFQLHGAGDDGNGTEGHWQSNFNFMPDNFAYHS